jgi:hypothetical protein
MNETFETSNEEFIFYIDHKWVFKETLIRQLISFIDNNALLVIEDPICAQPEWFWQNIDRFDTSIKKNYNKTSVIKKTQVFHEYCGICVNQGRYNYYNDHIINYLHDRNKKYETEGRVCLTGFILYNTRHPMTNEIRNFFFNEIIESKTPCCQLAFFFVNQKYNNFIKKIKYEDLPVDLFYTKEM